MDMWITDLLANFIEFVVLSSKNAVFPSYVFLPQWQTKNIIRMMGSKQLQEDTASEDFALL